MDHDGHSHSPGRGHRHCHDYGDPDHINNSTLPKLDLALSSVLIFQTG